MSHDSDFYSWAMEQAALLRQGRLAELDVANLIEEVEDMGRSEMRELESRLAVLLAHLLKWRYQPSHRGTSWEATIREQRRKVYRVLVQNPSLKQNIDESLVEAYGDARLAAMRETGFKLHIFPVDCPWLFIDALDDSFWPEQI